MGIVRERCAFHRSLLIICHFTRRQRSEKRISDDRHCHAKLTSISLPDFPMSFVHEVRDYFLSLFLCPLLLYYLSPFVFLSRVLKIVSYVSEFWDSWCSFFLLFAAWSTIYTYFCVCVCFYIRSYLNQAFALALTSVEGMVILALTLALPLTSVVGQSRRKRQRERIDPV